MPISIEASITVNLAITPRLLQDFDRAIRINPQYADAYFYRGVVHAFQGDQDEAINDWKTAAGLGYEDARQLLKSQGID